MALPSVCGTQNHALRDYAIVDEAPQGNEQLTRQRDDHLLARAADGLGASFKPLGQGTLLLEVKETPRELDHSSPHPRVTGSGEPLFAAFAAALVRRAGEAAVAGYGAPVAHIA